MIDRRRSISHSIARAALPLGAIAVVACHDSADTRVTVEYVARAGTGVAGFLASLQAGQTVEVFGVDADSTPAPVLEMKTPASGFVLVTAALVDSLGTIGGGATAIELRRDATLSVKVQIDSVNPKVGCTECLGAKAFALSPEHQRVPTDSIWMVWTATLGGTSITK